MQLYNKKSSYQLLDVVTVLSYDGQEHVVRHVPLQGQVREGVPVEDDGVQGAAV